MNTNPFEWTARCAGDALYVYDRGTRRMTAFDDQETDDPGPGQFPLPNIYVWAIALRTAQFARWTVCDGRLKTWPHRALESRRGPDSYWAHRIEPVHPLDIYRRFSRATIVAGSRRLFVLDEPTTGRSEHGANNR